MEYHEVAFGPEASIRMRELLGENPRNINNDIYLQPYREGFALADGRYAIKTTTKYGFSVRAFIFPDFDSYNRAWGGHYLAMPDPETGNYRTSAEREVA
jgi:hypothetical protein